MDHDTSNPQHYQEQPAPAHQPSPSSPYHPASQDAVSVIRQVQKASAWVLIVSAIMFALVGIMAVWGAFGDNTDTAWKSIASLSIVALAALVVNVGARIFEGKH